MVVISPEKIFYQRVGLADAGEIIDKTVLKGEIIDRLLYVDPATGEKVVHEDEVPFYKKQTRLVFGLNSKVDPESLEDYLAIGGYSALGKALTGMKPEAIIQEVIKANLRGGAEEDSLPAGNGRRPGRQRAIPSTSSATPTKVIPAPIWTGASWRGIPIWSSRG